ncbi:hypothetical protein L1049_008424 [Liquidambar formosana]|uniref:Pentatricopeptide repeat-containing protein n=1 Tax=Liquidambar formosana TaxID=63359 RepID=A0AAP0X5L6_LIQFO
MYTLFPTSLLPCPPKSQSAFFPLKAKPPSSSFNSSFKLIYAQSPKPKTSQLSIISSVSTCEQTLSFNDWPQILQISIGSGDLFLGQAIHAFLVKTGSQNDAVPGNNLVNLYAKFGKLDDAQRVFDEMLVRNTITWTSLMKGYLQINDVESVFRIVSVMHKFEEEFNEHTISVILQACNTPGDWIRGEQMHGFVIKGGFEENVFVGTSLLSMYLRSGYLADAEKVFNAMAYKDVRCLNFMISEYGKMGHGEKAMDVFLHMLGSGLEPNDYTFTSIITACNGDIGVEVGRQLHGYSVKCALVSETSVGNAMITLYGKHGLVEESERVFYEMGERNLVSWTALLSAYVKNSDSEKALVRFLEVLDHGIYLDSSCLATVLDGCSECKNLELGLQIHGFVLKLGHLSDVNVGTALIDLYAKCRNLQSARMAFNGLSGKTIASFNAILAGFTEMDGNEEDDAMLLFSQLRLAGAKPDSVTFARLLTLSAGQACLLRGKSLHAYTIKTGFESDIAVGNAVITMYAKCGSIEDAYQMFSSMNDLDSISWNAMVSAYALHGQGNKAILLFQEMERQGFVPDAITILAVLQACNYSGLWEDGLFLFNEMEPKYGVRPAVEHFCCLVDLLGRSGHLSEAVDFINKSLFSDSPLLWRTLVHVCKLRGDLSFGKTASKHLLELAPEEAGSYILVSNMYAGRGMLEEAAKVRTVMNDLKVGKEAGCSWIEINNKVHRFVASGKDHPQSTEIYVTLDLLKAGMKYTPNDSTDLQLIWDPVPSQQHGRRLVDPQVW